MPREGLPHDLPSHSEPAPAWGAAALQVLYYASASPFSFFSFAGARVRGAVVPILLFFHQAILQVFIVHELEQLFFVEHLYFPALQKVPFFNTGQSAAVLSINGISVDTEKPGPDNEGEQCGHCPPRG